VDDEDFNMALPEIDVREIGPDAEATFRSEDVRVLAWFELMDTLPELEEEVMETPVNADKLSDPAAFTTKMPPLATPAIELFEFIVNTPLALKRVLPPVDDNINGADNEVNEAGPLLDPILTPAEPIREKLPPAAIFIELSVLAITDEPDNDTL